MPLRYKTVALGGDMVLRFVAQFFNAGGDVEEAAEVAVDIVGGAVGDKEFFRPFVFDGEAKELQASRGVNSVLQRRRLLTSDLPVKEPILTLIKRMSPVLTRLRPATSAIPFIAPYQPSGIIWSAVEKVGGSLKCSFQPVTWLVLASTIFVMPAACAR